MHYARPGLKLHPCLNIISGSSLPPQPEEREERKAIDSRHTPSITSHPSPSLCLFVLPQRSKSDTSHAANYSTDHWNSNVRWTHKKQDKRRTRRLINCVLCHHAEFYKTKKDIIEFNLTALVELKPSGTLDNWRRFFEVQWLFSPIKDRHFESSNQFFCGKRSCTYLAGWLGLRSVEIWFDLNKYMLTLDCDTFSWDTIVNTLVPNIKMFYWNMQHSGMISHVKMNKLPSVRMKKKHVAKIMHLLSQFRCQIL